MNRRGFLGFFGAAAASGPKLAGGIAEAATSHMPVGSSYLAPAGICSTSSGGDWRSERISELRRILEGKDPSAEREAVMNRLYAAEMRERIRLDGLRSISPASRYRILTDGEPSRRERIKRQDAQFNLLDLLSGN